MKKLFYLFVVAFAATNLYSQAFLEFAAGGINDNYDGSKLYFTDVGISYKLFNEKLMLSGIYTSNYYQKYIRKSNIYSLEISPRLFNIDKFSLYLPINVGYWEKVNKDNDIKKGTKGSLGLKAEYGINKDAILLIGGGISAGFEGMIYAKLGVMFKL